MIGRKPNRTVIAPASGCRNPQARFCTASASVKSETDILMSCVSGCRKMPKLCRKPMLSVSIREAPIRMGSVGRRICSRGIFDVLPLAAALRRKPAVTSGLITPICVISI